MYNNEYNNKISERVKRNLKKQMQHQEINNSMAEPTFVTELEIETMKDLNITGGSGYVASTLQRPRL
jgi:ribosome-binding factor A